MEGNILNAASADAIIANSISEALKAASLALDEGEDRTCEGLWQIVSSDELASSFFLKSASKSLGLELPTTLLQCSKVSEVVARVAELSAQCPDHLRARHSIRALGVRPKIPRVAIVSVSCRLPGGVETLADLWSDVLLPGKDAITAIPITRWDANLLYDPDGGEGASYVREGGFIEDADAFDNRFFEISDNEAAQMDPQQRLLLEAAFEARAPLAKAGSHQSAETGVFIGCSCADWEDCIQELVDTSAVRPLAFVRGHAVVHSGRAFSTTAPSESAERRAMEGALAKARMLPGDIDYIEAHGTGTRMGDAVEFESLAAIFGDSHEADRPLLVGSIKGNIGHCEGSSGAAGICKAILVLIHRCVPATLHFNRLSDLIDKTPRYFSIPRAATYLPNSEKPLVVGISSFGIGGCNGHTILESGEAAGHDFRAQLNEKCTWKRNRFPWAHLVSIPGIASDALITSEALFSHDGLGSQASFISGTPCCQTASLHEHASEQTAEIGVPTGQSVHEPGAYRADLGRSRSSTHGNLVSPKCWLDETKVSGPAKLSTIPPSRGDADAFGCSIASSLNADVTPPEDQEREKEFRPRVSLGEIRTAVEESLKLALKGDDVPEDTVPFVEAGVDSMTSIGVRESLSKKLQIQLPATILYDRPCIAELVKYLAQELSGDPRMHDHHSVLDGSGVSPRRGDVAIISVACRFPPGAHSGSEFWEVLEAGRDCIEHIPLDRFDVWKYRSNNANAPNSLYVNDAGTYPEMTLFDNAAFSISMAEAELMDPHQRVLLEICNEALAPVLDDKSSLDIGIIVGCCNNDWVREACTTTKETKSLSGTGGAASIVSNRLSYVFNLHGPSMTIDTACSSSLVALDVAKQLLDDGRLNLSLAAGVHVLVNHYVFEQYCKAGMLSVDGRCKTFDASANGYVRSEGCGAVLLKVLPRETTDPHSVCAWIRGTANNHVGRSASLTAPNGPAQQAVIRAALHNAGIQSPAEVSVLEAHGTGTSLGDPIEVGAIRAVYCNGFPHSPPLILGALKSLMGHAEGAAGIAGLIKLILVLQHRTATPNLHLNTLNPHIDLDKGDRYRDILFPSKCVPLGSLFGMTDSQPLLGAVSSFGFGGSNAHAIVEVPPIFKPTWTTNETHAAADLEEASATKIWLFSGQGSQYLDMACAYFRHSPIFKDTISACTDTLKQMSWFPTDGPQSIEDLVYGTEWQPDAQAREEILSSTQYSQVAIFAVELALSKVLMDRGLKPDIVLGHSLGEYAAAAVAGVMEWEDALRLVAKRASLLAAQPQQDGVMVACRTSAATVQTALSTQLQHLQAVSLAGDNGPQSVTIAGNKEQVDTLLEYLGVAANSKRLQVSHAFHSPLMAGAVSEMEALASTIKFQPATAAIASTVFGRMLTESDTPDAQYWATQVTLPVRFREAVEAAVEAAASDRIVFVEVGPQRTLVNLAAQVVSKHEGKKAHWLNLVDKGENADAGLDMEKLKECERACGILPGTEETHKWNHQ
ncbi:hypothetical protein Emed_000778 [Eimeria media]